MATAAGAAVLFGLGFVFGTVSEYTSRLHPGAKTRLLWALYGFVAGVWVHSPALGPGSWDWLPLALEAGPVVAGVVLGYWAGWRLAERRRPDPDPEPDRPGETAPGNGAGAAGTTVPPGARVTGPSGSVVIGARATETDTGGGSGSGGEDQP